MIRLKLKFKLVIIYMIFTKIQSFKAPAQFLRSALTEATQFKTVETRISIFDNISTQNV